MSPKIAAALIFAPLLIVAALVPAQSKPAPYPHMAPIAQYLMPRTAEIALARSAAPASIADSASVMVLGRQGYTTAARGTNGFLCYVERSWAKTTDAPDFWNPKMRSPNCFNPAAAKSVTQIYMMKTRLVLAGKSRVEIAQAIAATLQRRELPAPAPGAMCYMMSKHQYLNDQDRSWYPHLMFYAAGDTAKSWGANLPGSPMIASNDPEARVTTFMVVVAHWSDGTPRPH